MNPKEIIAKHKATIELHAFSAAYAITPTLVNFYRENLASTETIKAHFISALEGAIEHAMVAPVTRDDLGQELKEAEFTVLYRFQARARLHKEYLSFDFNYVLNGAAVALES